MSEIHFCLLLAALLFAIGVFGLLTRRNAIGILLSVELMANAVNINLVALSRFITPSHRRNKRFARSIYPGRR